MFEAARDITGHFAAVVGIFNQPIFLVGIAMMVVGYGFDLIRRLFRHGTAEAVWFWRMKHPPKGPKQVPGMYMGVGRLVAPAGWTKVEWKAYQYAKQRGDSMWKNLTRPGG